MFAGYPHCHCDDNDGTLLEWTDDFCGGIDSAPASSSSSESVSASDESVAAKAKTFADKPWIEAVITVAIILLLICLVGAGVLYAQSRKVKQFQSQYQLQEEDTL